MTQHFVEGRELNKSYDANPSCQLPFSLCNKVSAMSDRMRKSKPSSEQLAEMQSFVVLSYPHLEVNQKLFLARLF